MVTLTGRFGAAFARGFAAGLAAGLAAARFGEAFLVEVTFVALFARALPGGERLVAGLRRVDLATRLRAFAPLAEERAVEREDSLFSGLLIVNCDLPLK